MKDKSKPIEIAWETVEDPHAEEAVMRVFVMLLRDLNEPPVEKAD